MKLLLSLCYCIYAYSYNIPIANKHRSISGSELRALSQEEQMHADLLIEVDTNDRMIGRVTKGEAHTVSQTQPQGRLHRAFSVFLFNSKGELLLQRRADSKITFPGVWTNTCCSHPLHCEAELDAEDDILTGKVPGIRAAAIRKLREELGVVPGSVPADHFKFLTRIRYFARDQGTYGADSPWCEHEVDYILFARADVKCEPNPDEVSAVRYVDAAELAAMLADPALAWSPWFRLIVDRFLADWWRDLDTALTTDTFEDWSTIHALR